MVSEGFLKFINFLPIACIILGLVGDFLSYHFWSLVISGIVKIFLVGCLILLEIKPKKGLVKPFSFMFYFLGRGAFYIIIGFTTMGVNNLSIIGSFLTVGVGIMYISFHYTNKNGEPDFMSFNRYLRFVNADSQNTSPYINQTVNNSYPSPYPPPAAATPTYENTYPQSPMHNPGDKIEVTY